MISGISDNAFGSANPITFAHGPAKNRIGLGFGPTRSDFNRLVPFWVRFGSVLGPFWVRFGSVLGPFWVRFGSVLDPFWVRLGSVLGRFLVRFGSVLGSRFRFELIAMELLLD